MAASFHLEPSGSTAGAISTYFEDIDAEALSTHLLTKLKLTLKHLKLKPSALDALSALGMVRPP